MGRVPFQACISEEPQDCRLRRPIPLVLDDLVGAGDLQNDVATPAACAQQRARKQRQEVPVHRTFIEFAMWSPSEIILRAWKTAPAALGLSICVDIKGNHDSSTPISPRNDVSQSQQVENALLVTYCYSPASARAAGISEQQKERCVSNWRGLLSGIRHEVRQKERVLEGWRVVHDEERLDVISKERYLNTWRSFSSEASPLEDQKAQDISQPQQDMSAARPTIMDVLYQGGVQQRQAMSKQLPCQSAEANLSSTEDDDWSDDDDDDDQELCPVYFANAELPSVGSAGHGEGMCKRCCFFPKGRCTNGSDCQFCHFAHEKRKSNGKKKKKSRRRKQRQLASQRQANQQTPVFVIATSQQNTPPSQVGASGSIVVQELMPAQSMASQCMGYYATN